MSKNTLYNMAVTTDPNAVFYSYRGVGTNMVVKKFIDFVKEVEAL